MALPTIEPPRVALRLTPQARVDATNGAVRVVAPWAEHALAARGALAREMICGLADAPLTNARAQREAAQFDDAQERERFATDIYALLTNGLARECALGADGAPLATLVPVARHYSPLEVSIDASTPVALSRFSFLRRHAVARGLVVESPLAFARVHLDAPVAALVVAALATGATLEQLAAEADLDLPAVAGVVGLLLRAGVAGAVDDDGKLQEDRDPALRQWHFHDLLFHSRSRLGRHDEPVGGHFRFLGELAPQPVVKRAPWPLTIALPRPDLATLAFSDPPLTAVIEGRRSVRLQHAHPIGLQRLGEFLYRVARIRGRHSAGDKGEYSSRPCPSGGACHELEIYVNVGDTAGVSAGFYWYDPLAHGLCRVREPDADTHALLQQAYESTGGLGRPQVLFILAARFQRVSWKYDAIAYATILKNTGVVYSTMYLVATAMGLAPCAIGLGDADLFARVAGTRYVEESSVGEFMLCGAATPPHAR